MSRGWKDVVVLWLVGVLAAAQLAKFAVLAPEMRHHFGLSLPGMGLLISLMEVGGALFGFVAGLHLGRVGARRSLVAGLALMAATGAIEALSSGVELLFAARAVEGLGYLLVVISAPTLIVAIASEDEVTPALALWSSFVAVGMAVGSALTGGAEVVLGSGGALLAWSGASLAALLLVRTVDEAIAGRRREAALPRAAVWLSTLGFGSYTMFASATIALLPSLLVERAGMTLGAASLATGLASLSSFPGSIITLWLLRGRPLDRRRAVGLLVPTLAAVVVAPLGFSIIRMSPGPVATATAVLISLLSGMATPVIFGRLPALAGALDRIDPRIATANGLITQFGAAGALAGPPLCALMVSSAGWEMLGMMVSLLAAAMLALVSAAEASTAPYRR